MFKRFSALSKFLPRPGFSLARSFCSAPIPPYEKHCKLFKDQPDKYSTRLLVEKDMTEMKIFRLLDLQGNLLSADPNIDKALLLKIYDIMVKTEAMDNILYMAQRQGKISFYMPSLGEVACTVASTAALKDNDLLFPQYREQGSLLWRGFSIAQCTNQCFGNHLDVGKGRQMPVHYGSKDLNYVTVSSPLSNYFETLGVWVKSFVFVSSNSGSAGLRSRLCLQDQKRGSGCCYLLRRGRCQRRRLPCSP